MSTPKQATNTTAFFVQAGVSFGLALLSLLIGILYLEVDPWVRAFLGLAVVFLAYATSRRRPRSASDSTRLGSTRSSPSTIRSRTPADFIPRRARRRGRARRILLSATRRPSRLVQPARPRSDLQPSSWPS